MKILIGLLTILTTGLLTSPVTAASKVLPAHIQAMFSKPTPATTNPFAPATAPKAQAAATNPFAPATPAGTATTTPFTTTNPANSATNAIDSAVAAVATKPVATPPIFSSLSTLRPKIPSTEELAKMMLETNAQTADFITLLATTLHAYPIERYLDDDFTTCDEFFTHLHDKNIQRSHAFESNQYIASVYQLISDAYDVALERPRKPLIALAEAARATYAACIERNARQYAAGTKVTTALHKEAIKKLIITIPLLHLAEYIVNRLALAGANKWLGDSKHKDNYSKRRWVVFLATLLADAAVGGYLFNQTMPDRRTELIAATEKVAALRMVQHLLAEILGRRLRSKTRDNAGFLLLYTPA